MANTFLTPEVVAKEALMVLTSNLVMADLVHRDYAEELVSVGDTVSIRRPAKFVAKNFTGTAESQDVNEGSVAVKLDRFRDVTVASLYDGTAEEFARFDAIEQELAAAFGDKCVAFRAANRIIDIHAKGVSKSRAARELQARLGRKTLVCVGDAHNDIPMLDGADYAFCPSDGGVADRYENVCKCADGAVADVIYEKIPEILAISP